MLERPVKRESRPMTGILSHMSLCGFAGVILDTLNEERAMFTNRIRFHAAIFPNIGITVP